MLRWNDILFRLLYFAKDCTIVTKDKKGTAYELHLNLGGKKRKPAQSAHVMDWALINIPGAEVYIAPLEKVAHGDIIINGSMLGHILPCDVLITFKDGKIENWKAMDMRFQEVLDDFAKEWQHDPTWSSLCEFGIGVNNAFKTVTGIQVLDEKMSRTCHIGIGSNKEFSGEIESEIHEDFVTIKPTIIINGKTIMKDGHFTIDETDVYEDIEQLSVSDDIFVGQEYRLTVRDMDEEDGKVGLALRDGTDQPFFLQVGNNPSSRKILEVLKQLDPTPEFSYNEIKALSKQASAILSLLLKYNFIKCIKTEDKPLWERCFEKIGLEFPLYKFKNTDTDYAHIRYFDLTEFRLKLGIFTPFYYIKDVSGFENSQEFLELKGRSKAAFIISEQIPVHKLATPIVLIDEKVLLQTDKIERKTLILRKLQEQCSLETLSPYETDAAVFGDKFFGRPNEIDRITTNESTNYIIFGSRRMGKTSLLKHLEYIYNSKKFSIDINRPNSGRAIFLSCLGVYDLNSFQQLLISALAPSDYWKDSFQKLARKKSWEVYTQNYFKNLACKYKMGILLLLDEIDAMIESQDCEEIVKFQRMLSTVGFRFIQTGYRAVWREMQKYGGSFWNFSDPLHIAQFNRNDSLELIETPMESMGIKLAEGIAQTIYQETGGIPNYIQHYCSVIVSEAQFHNNKEIDKKVFGFIDGSPNFDRIVMNSIHQNIRFPKEKLIVYFAANSHKDNFSIFQILDFCRKQKIDTILYDDIRKSMDILIKMGFVQPAGQDHYRLIAPITKKALRKRNIDRNLAETVKTLKTLHD